MTPIPGGKNPEKQQKEIPQQENVAIQTKPHRSKSRGQAPKWHALPQSPPSLAAQDSRRKRYSTVSELETNSDPRACTTLRACGGHTSANIPDGKDTLSPWSQLQLCSIRRAWSMGTVLAPEPRRSGREAHVVSSFQISCPSLPTKGQFVMSSTCTWALFPSLCQRCLFYF